MKERAEYWSNVFKKRANERNFETNSEEYKSDVLEQTLSKFYTFKIQLFWPLCC